MLISGKEFKQYQKCTKLLTKIPGIPDLIIAHNDQGEGGFTVLLIALCI